MTVNLKIEGGLKMDALELLRQDHERVKELFEQAEATEGGEEQKEIFKQIKKELETHARIEESIFYPAMEKHEELKDMVLEAIEEHKQVKTLLHEMDDLVADSEKFEPKLKVLMENVEHHAEEEEEGNMFPKIRELLDDAALEQLGQELESAKSKKSQAA
jgi:hemerythrin superfamily protein